MTHDDWTNTEPVQPHSYTHIDPDHPEDDIVVCNDCGASGEREDEIVHYPTCHPGESNYWQQYYSEHPDGYDADDPYEQDGGADFEQENS